MQANKNSYTTRAAFLRGGRWGWIRWTHGDANKHAAILGKATEIGAQGCDFGNADHDETSRYSFETR
jgi:hypothetical protein